jgi:hypothetical protein
VDEFIARHRDKVVGVLSCCDRVIFKGHLNRLSYPEGLESFLDFRGIKIADFKHFATRQADRIKEHARAVASQLGRPHLHLEGYRRKEDLARAIGERDKVADGLICILTAVEPCRTFKLLYGKGRPKLASARRKCLFVYFYYMLPRFGLVHFRIQTWLPFEVQIYVNGHDWLAKRLDRASIAFRQRDNAFPWIEDFRRAQCLADTFFDQKWITTLTSFACVINPLLYDTLKDFEYYWVVDQCEFTTDVVFKDRSSLQPLFHELLRYATVHMGAEDILSFLGRKLHPSFAGEVLTDCKRRIPGYRVKHRMKQNWIKSYDKFGVILRIETVINQPREFRVFREGTRKGRPTRGWFPMKKGVSNFYRYREVSLSANARYLDALAVVADPRPAQQCVQSICQRTRHDGRSVPAINPLAPEERRLFSAILRGEHTIHGFRNKDIRSHLFSPTRDTAEIRRRSARVSRLLRRLHHKALIAKIPRSRRWRLTATGTAFMAAALQAYDKYFVPKLAS